MKVFDLPALADEPVWAQVFANFPFKESVVKIYQSEQLDAITILAHPRPQSPVG